MKIYKVVRSKDTVIVSIFKNKIDNTYSYINLTKEHICPCKFNSVEEALKDMDELIKQGEIEYYTEYIN